MYGSSQNIVELKRLIAKVLEWTSLADDEDTEEAWDRAYSLVFSRDSSLAIRDLMKNMGVHLNYSDPDTSYKEDVQAYSEALNEVDLSPFDSNYERSR